MVRNNVKKNSTNFYLQITNNLNKGVINMEKINGVEKKPIFNVQV